MIKPEKLLFVDVALSPKYKTYAELKKEDPKLWHTWTSKVDLSKVEMFFWANNDKSLSFDEKLALYYKHDVVNRPEYCELVSVSLGLVKDGENKIKTIHSDDQKVVLDKVYETFNKVDGKYILAGSGLKYFVIPVLCKFFVKHGLKIPKYIQRYLNAKPWETNFVDVTELWAFNKGSYTSLELTAKFLECFNETVKDDNLIKNANSQSYVNVDMMMNTYRKLHNSY